MPPRSTTKTLPALPNPPAQTEEAKLKCDRRQRQGPQTPARAFSPACRRAGEVGEEGLRHKAFHNEKVAITGIPRPCPSPAATPWNPSLWTSGTHNAPGGKYAKQKSACSQPILMGRPP